MPGFQARKLLTPVVVVLLALHVLGFAVPAVLSKTAEPMVGALGLSLSRALGGLFLWQFVTHSFLYPIPCMAWDLVFTGILLLFLGSRLEREWGARRVVIYYVLMACFTGLFRTFAPADPPGVPIFGSIGIFCAILGTSAVVFRSENFWVFFTIIKGHRFFLALLFITLLLNLVSMPAVVGVVSGAVLGYLYPRILFRRQFGKRISGSAASGGNRFADIDMSD